jgi:hypothetical protein
MLEDVAVGVDDAHHSHLHSAAEGESGKRKAESGKRKEESGKRKEDCM